MRGSFHLSGILEKIKTLGAIMMILVLPVLLGDNCGDSDSTSTIDRPGPYGGAVFWFSGNKRDSAGEKALGTAVEIGLALKGGTEGSPVELEWTPPEGALTFEFEGNQPSNPAGPPPFLFSDVPVHETTPSAPDLTVRYVPPSRVGDYRFVDTFVSTAPSGARHGFSLSRRNAKAGPEAQLPHVISTQRAEKAAGVGWRWVNWFYREDPVDLEQSQAQRLIDYLQSGAFFIALRFPVPQEAESLDYALPVVMEEGEEAHLAILDHSMPWGGDDLSQAVADLPMEYDPARQEFLENSLPRQTATRWAALRPVQTPVELEGNFPISGEDWEIFTKGVLDLRDMPDSCAECRLEFYICHEGTDEPAFLDFLASKGAVSYQGEGMSCFGPSPKRLTDHTGFSQTDPPFIFDGPNFGRVTPPEQVQLFHDITGTASSPVSVVLQVESSMGLEWRLYHGDFEHADLNRPITAPLSLPRGSQAIWIIGDVPADAQGAETVTLRASEANDASKTTWTTSNLWIGNWIPPETQEWSAWIPVASHAAGAQGSAWRTDLGLLNSGTATVEATISLQSGSGELSMQRSIAAGSQDILRDVVDQLGLSGAGSLKITAPGALVMTSRTYSQVGGSANCYPSGTLGQSLASSDDSLVLSSGSSALIPQLVENEAYRTNIAVTNTGQTQAQLRVHLDDGDGTELTSYDVSLEPGQWKQENQPFLKKAGMTDMAAGYAEIEVLSGAGIVSYGSVVDNTTNDPTTMVPVLASAASASAWIPVASHAGGANGSAWRTDLGLLNPDNTAVEVEIRLHASSGDSVMSREIPAGAQQILGDVLDLMGTSGAGALEITGSSGVIVSSRTYSQVGSTAACYPSGTLGQSLASTAQIGTISAGQSAMISQLTENADYRSNIAVTNTGSSHAEVRVYLYDAAGTELTSYDVSLDPGQWKQENQPFWKKAGLTDMGAGYAKVEVLSGSGVTGYGSVVDNTTNDPTTMSMIR